MKRQTEKKYKQLPEVQNKKLELKRMESYRRNQIMAKVFTQVSFYSSHLSVTLFPCVSKSRNKTVFKSVERFKIENHIVTSFRYDNLNFLTYT